MCCMLLVLNACPSVPPSTGETLPAAQTDTSPAVVPEKADNLAEALDLSSRIISGSMDSGSSIAIISITAADLFEGEYALEELTMLLVMTRKFRVVDRRNLDIIRAEQQFQLSGEVDDETAVSIGHLIGAAFVITGSISPWESAKFLRLRVLDVQTGQIRAMSSIAYGGNL